MSPYDYIYLNVFVFILAKTPTEEIIAVEGLSTQLPCDVTPPKPGEQVYLVLWYRQEDGGEPIYRFVNKYMHVQPLFEREHYLKNEF